MGPVVKLPVMAGHVVGDGDVGMRSADPGMGGDAVIPVEHLDRARRDADVDLFLQQPIGHGVEACVDLDVVVDADAGAAPLGVFVPQYRKRPQRRPIGLLEQLASAHPEVAHDAGVEVAGQRFDLRRQFVEAEEGPVAQPGQDPTLDDLDADLDLGLVARGFLGRVGSTATP